MILADTSAWIEFDRATGSAVDQRLTGLIRSGGPLAVTEPVLMEVLAGARTDRRVVFPPALDHRDDLVLAAAAALR